ncbi:NAD(P)H-binding protein [Glaciibacter sp. 2TAF33]|uniref:NAD(P)H-binding protein n=1 Tax=Glaciibacter sp. 2TAF33 TaxID=3233015 RepID=UPI003F90A597
MLGATGYIGGRLVPRLLNGGYSVRVLVRSPERLAAFSWTDSVKRRVGDARNRSVVSEAMTDGDVVYFLVHSMSSGKHFSSIDRDIAQNVARAARSAGVKRIVYLGGLFPEHAALSPHLASRKEVGELLLASGMPAIVLRAGVVIGSGSASFEMIRHLTEVLPYMPARPR